MTVEELQIIISMKTEQVHAKIDKLKEKIAGIQPKKSPDINITTTKAQGNLKKLQAELSRTQAKIEKLSAQQNAVQAKIDTRAGMYSGVPNLTGMGHEETVGTLMDQDPEIQKLTEQMGVLDAQTTPLKAHLAGVEAQISTVGSAAEPAAAKTRALGESMKSAGNSARSMGTSSSRLGNLLSSVKERLSSFGNSAQTAGQKLQGAGRNGSYFGRMVSRMLLSMLLYRGIAFVAQSITQGFQNMALGSSQANATMSQLATSSLYLKNSFGAALFPVVQALTPAFLELSNAIAGTLQRVAELFAALNGKSSVLVAKQAQVDYAKTVSQSGNDAARVQQKQAAAAEQAAQRAAKAQEKAAARQSAAEKRVQDAIDEHQKKLDALKRSLMGFDELNVLSAPADTWKPPTVPGYTSNVPTSGSLDTAAPPVWNGMPSQGDMFKSVNIPQKVSDIANKVKQVLNDLKQYLLGAGLIAAGAIICLFGNPGLGIALMIAGFVALGYQIVKNEGNMSGRVRQELASVIRIIGTMLFAIGTIVMLSGNLGLGLALIIAGAASFAVAAKLDFDSTKSTVRQKLTDILAAIGALVAAIGIILAITGHLPLGIGLIIAGAAALGVSAGLNFSAMPEKTKAALTQVLAVVGSVLAAIGIILILSCPAALPLGIGLLIAGAAALGTAVGLNWDSIRNAVSSHLQLIEQIAGGVLLALGLIIALACPAALPLGIGLMVAGGFLLAKSFNVDWDFIPRKAREALQGVKNAWNGIGDWFGGIWNSIISKFHPDMISSGFKSAWNALTSWRFPTPHIWWGSGGWQSSGWIYNVLSTLHLPTSLPSLNVDWYAKGGIFDNPSLIGVGEAGPEAVLPLNDNSYSRIAEGISENDGNACGDDTDRIIDRLDRLSDAIQNMKLALYTDDCTIAESANRGNKQISKRYHRAVTE